MNTIVERLLNASQVYADKVALIDHDGGWTYRELFDNARRIASQLKTVGVQREDYVTIEMPRCKAYVASILGCWFVGAAAVALDSAYPRERLEFIEKDCACTAVVSPALVEAAMACDPLNEVENVTPETKAYAVYTSGSTGNPKGVLHGHDSVLATCERFISATEADSDDVGAFVPPLSFIPTLPEIFGRLSVGASVVLISEHVRKDPELLANVCAQYQVTSLFMPPKILKYFVPKSDSLRTVIVGSEKLSQIYYPWFRILNIFGMSELAGNAISFEVDRAYDNTPIGKPLRGLCAYVLDENGHEVEEGELCITGIFAREYIGLPEQTASTFVPNPFAAIDGHACMLHTHDIVRRLPDGNLLYVNRQDWMLKINGQRVEPGEVEAVIRKHENIMDCAVKGFENERGAYLCAYYVEKAPIPLNDMRAMLAKQLPPYMIPSIFVKMDKLPVNTNGKLAYKDLQAPDLNQFKAAYVAPTNGVEKKLCQAFELVLGVTNVGLDDDFFSLGGDSIRTLALVEKCTDLHLSSRDVFQGRTPRAIAEIAQAAQGLNYESISVDLTEVALNDSQLGVYLDTMQDPGSLMYNNPCCYQFDARGVSATKLAAAIQTVVKAHDAFACCVKVVHGEPHLVRCLTGLPTPNIVSASPVDVETLKKRFVQPFDLENGPLYRFEIIQTEQMLYLLFDMHHLVFDGTSLGVIQRDIEAAYAEQSIDPERVSVLVIAPYEAQHQAEADEDFHYFERQLSGVDIDSNLLSDRPDASASTAGEFVVFAPQISSVEVEQFTHAHGITENTLFLSAFALALAKFTCQTESLFCTVDNGRHSPALNQTVGMFVRTLPMYVKIDASRPSVDYLNAVQSQCFENMTHDQASFARMAREFGVRSDIMFVYQADMHRGLKLGAAEGRIDRLESGASISNLSTMVFKHNGRYEFRIEYRTCLYHKDTMIRFGEVLECLVNGLMACDRLDQINITKPDRLAELERFNQTASPVDWTKTVVDWFDEQAARQPDHTALVHRDTRYTYRELDEITQRIAADVQRRGIGRDAFVGVLVGRNVFAPIAWLGVLRAGAAYQPLDPTYPQDRLNFMIHDSGAHLLIADRDLRPLLNEYTGDVLFTDEFATLPPCDVELSAPRPQDALTILYTSGTTGMPKGCVLEHKNLMAIHATHSKNMHLNSETRMASYASFGFDASVEDIFTTLAAGGSLYILDDEIRLDLNAMEAYFIENGITNSFMTTQVARMFLGMTKCSTLKYFMFGGEKLVPFTPPKNVTVYNGYGPSEALCYVATHRIVDDSHLQPIGKANLNMKFYVVDRALNRLPVGVCGELCVAGPQVSRGYLNRPEKTAEVFVNNPFSDDPAYRRMYRTGDIVRMLPNGEVDFVGRRDGQVKIRGFRVELTEVEKVIRDYAGIHDAAVAAFDAPTGGKFLTAYVTADQKIDSDALKDFILKSKPAYMVPAAIMQIEAIPVNVNGKVDKRKLPKPEIKFDDIVKPKNEIQARIFDKIKEIIGTDQFGIHTDIFEAGLTSIGCIKLNVLLSDEFGVAFQTRDLKANNTVEKLEAFIQNAEALSQFEVLDDYPLTKTQEGILVECMAHPNSTLYNIPLLLKLDASLDVERIKQAIVASVRAHAFINTILFVDHAGDIRQKRRDASSDFKLSDIEVIQAESLDAIKASLIRPFKLMGERLFRVVLIQAEALYLLVDMHHIISDGTSLDLFLDDVSRAYQGETLVPESFSGFEMALMEQQKRATPALEAAKKYYETLLAGYDEDYLIKKDRRRDDKRPYAPFEMDGVPGMAARVTAFCKNHKVSVNGLLCTAFGLALANFNGTDESVFTTVYNGRNDSRTMRMTAMLVKTLPVLCQVKGKTPLEVVKTVSDQLIDSMTNDIYSFAEISRTLGIKANVMFVYQGDHFEFDRFCGKPAQIQPVELDSEKAPLQLQISLRRDTFVYRVEYDQTLYTPELMQQLALTVDVAVGELIHQKDMAQISLLDASMRAQLDQFNDTDFEYDASKNVIDLFREAVAKYPEHIAVVHGDRRLTYAELDRLTDRLAAHLVKRGVKAEAFVSILIPRNEFMPIAALGILKAGGAYQPLDPTYPQERLNFMVQDSGARLIIADRALRPLVDAFNGDVLYTDEIDQLPACDCALPKIKPDQAFIILYTSGTTGTPKGCVLEHRNIVSFIHWNARLCDITPETRHAAYASFGFDANIMDTYPTLCQGAALYIIPDDIRLDLAAIEAFCIQNAITDGVMTTQMARMFLSMTKCSTLHSFSMGGEKLAPFTPPAHVRTFNSYGPTECTVYASSFEFRDDDPILPVGKANGNVKLYVVDPALKRLPIGGVGELCIAGPQVSRGYLNRPEKTAEVFVTNPFCDDPRYARMYRTGDIVRMLPNGNVDFIGRRDGQVKIRGFRIELPEVEQIIGQFDGITSTTVVAFDDPAGGKFLAAYFAATKKIDIAALTAFIQESKPPYMVPAAFMQLDAIPFNANGKVDKRKLPTPERQVQKIGKEPANELEAKICTIYQQILGLDKVYADDDFFAIGGSSISASKVVLNCMNQGLPVVYKNVFDNPTPKQLADFIAAEAVSNADVTQTDAKQQAASDFKALAGNVVENLDHMSRTELGIVLLAGATGFLGVHVLRELLQTTSGDILCLLRSKKNQPAEARLKTMLKYYFSDLSGFERIHIIEGDITDKTLGEKLECFTFDTIINCAACVKHFAQDDMIERVNYEGVKNLIGIAKQRGCKLIQTSTTSVAGESVDGSVPAGVTLRENTLALGQALDNKYIKSKYMAEQAMLEAIESGMRGKIMRMGNLMSRASDGEFQINFLTNGFMRQVKGYKKLGCFPVDNLDAHVEFSPIDCSAKAVVLLAGSPDEFTVFNVNNCFGVHMANVVQTLNEHGMPVDIVSRAEFQDRFSKMLGNEQDNQSISGLIAYMNNSGEHRVLIGSDNAFTIKALYRLGFAWPIIDMSYVKKAIDAVASLGFFD